MSKTLISIMVIAFVMLLQSGLGNSSSPTLATAVEKGIKEPSVENATAVEVTLEGLMVLHRKAGDRYEVGILPPEIAREHTFTIQIDNEKPIDLSSYPRDKGWVLEVRKPSGGTSGPGTRLRERGHYGRLRDSRTGQSDFSWAVDLESPEFHGRPLTLRPGNLKPIIQLPDGELYTKYKSPMVQRKLGTGSFSDFGFVAETTALSFSLQPGEKLKLKIADTSPEVVIFERAYGPGSYSIKIHNSPIKPSHASHFTYYYELFSDVLEKYDFRLKRGARPPYNLYPERSWIEGMPCGLVVLGKRTGPLE